MEVFEARSYIQTHDNRVKMLDRMTMDGLRRDDKAAMYRAGLKRLLGGPVSRDEFISDILELEFPDISEARRLYYESTQGEKS